MSLDVLCMMSFNIRVSNTEYASQFNEYLAGHNIDQNDIDTFRNYAVLLNPNNQLIVNGNQVLNAFNKYILYCICGDEHYYILGHNFVCVVDQNTINYVINNSMFIYSYDQYRKISSVSYMF
jgi:hypothetical protein